ncbi:exopolysaccharide biosynthesis polyprenyl glycosylphosphotransferase [Candidatus Fermentibacteria bacterium]|nr:exopolysaccharide biosynthesis polyprenyl glycosylphosphotransferase [Candidatus Fermentibacteria bacterium]
MNDAAAPKARPVPDPGVPPDLSVVIVNWNGIDYLEECLDSVFGHTEGISVHVTLVDNASTDGSADMVRTRYPQVTVLANSENVGFARANNQAFPFCTGRYVLLMNPDTRVLGDALSDMVRFMDAHPEAGIAGCRVLNPDLTLQLACRRSIPTPAVAFYRMIGLAKLRPSSVRFARYNLTFKDDARETEVDAVSGSFLMFRPEVLLTVGALDEQFFLYGEELDWCLRARRHGWKVLYNPAAEIIHYKGGLSKRNKLRSTYEFHRAMLLFHNKHFAGTLARPLNWLVSFGVLARGIIDGIAPVVRVLAIMALDAVCINLTQVAAFYLKLGGVVQPHFDAFLHASPVLTGITILVLWGARLYDEEHDRDMVQLAYQVARALTVAAGVFVLANFVSRRFATLTFPFPRSVFALGLILAVAPLAVVRTALLSRPTRKRGVVRVGIIGTGDAAQRLARELGGRLGVGSRFVGFVSTSGPESVGAPVLGQADGIAAVLHRYALTEVIIAVDSWPPHRLIEVIASCEYRGARVSIVPGLYEILIGRVELTNLAGMPLIKLPTDPLSGWYRTVKRGLDVVASGAGLLLTSWVCALVMLSTKLSSPGPALYRQVRVGRRGKQFVLLKFRTMIADAEKESGPVLASADDPRIVRFGGFLRSTHLDEIPQLINILKGEMSFVGPRPERPEFVEVFTRGDPAYQRRLVVRPGLTGLAQVHGRYDSEASDKLKYDLAYLNSINLGTDVRILLGSLRLIASALMGGSTRPNTSLMPGENS